jgi:hypothetical protein
MADGRKEMWWRETDGRGHSDGFSAGFWLVTFLEEWIQK